MQNVVVAKQLLLTKQKKSSFHLASQKRALVVDISKCFLGTASV